MKFIRDIIAEKTSMSEKDLADPVIRDHQADLSGDLDPVDMVASGGLSLGRGDHPAFLGEGAGLNGSADDGADAGGGHDEDDSFDLLSDTQDTGGAEESAENSEASELFADIWSEDGIDEDETEYEGADPQEDIFAADVPDPDMDMAPADDMALNNAPASMHETNAEALMRTMYKSQSEMPEEQTEGQDTGSDMPPVAGESPMKDQAEEPAGRPENSAFQAIMRRQQSIPSESVSEPEPVSAPKAEVAPEPMEPINVPAPAAGRARRQAGRVKTRLLGFSSDDGGETDLFAAGNAATPAVQTMFPVGWIVVASGPGRGNAFALFNGVSQIGRGEDQALRLDFGDSSISRSNHAAIAYDPEQKGFYLGHGGKANLVRLNGRPVLSTEPLESGALIRIGETTLRFVALCGADFEWDNAQEGEGNNARFG